MNNQSVTKQIPYQRTIFENGISLNGLETMSDSSASSLLGYWHGKSYMYLF